MAQPPSTLEELTSVAEELHATVDGLLERSEIYEAIVNTPASAVVVFGNPYAWRPLAREHQPLLARSHRVLETWETLGGAAVRSAAPSRLDAFRRHGEVLREVVEQQGGQRAPSSSIEGVSELVAQATEQQLEMLHDLPSAQGAGELLVIFDSNSVIFQPALEEWNPSQRPWTAVLVPQVIRELDELKMRDKPVAEAASSFIRRAEEYGRRGDTFEGVPLRQGARFREVPIEADMRHAPPWLRAAHADDQLLASVLELRWEDLTASVVLVTRDRNLRNKARLARVASIAVEDVAPSRPRRDRRDPVRDAQLEQAARERLAGTLPWARSQLGVPPSSPATSPNQQSWTVQAAPVEFDPQEFRRRVLGRPASEWFAKRVLELFAEPTPVPSSTPAEEPGQAGFAVSRDFRIPVEGSMRLVADAGGVVGARYYVEPNPDGARMLLLQDIEEDHFRPLIRACTDALTALGVSGRVLVEAWVRGVSGTAVLTGGHPTLGDRRDGWLTDGSLHVGGEVRVPADDHDVDVVVGDWGRQVARVAGIPAHEQHG
jgi:PIN domain